ncbi:MAG: phage tail protein, partial [Alkalibacterium sp.]|nr:phage tail protein [Alkalibacterium sp.]
MYDFIDINESSRRYSLPSEALILNGKVIEDVINGYQTLTVSGRELISSELNVERKQHNDGSIYIDKSYPPRTITIQYKL